MFESRIFLELLILFGAATFVATLCHYVQLPTIVGFLVTGLVVGPSGFALVSSLPNADSLAEIASIFLMFTIGLEFSFKRLFQLQREFIRLGLLQVVLTIMVVALLARVGLDVSLAKGIFLGFLVSLSSTALVMKLLQDARDLETPYGKNSLSILLFQDLAVIPMMLVLPLLAGEAGSGFPEITTRAVTGTILAVAGTLAGIWVATRYVIPTLLEKVVATRSREIFFFCVLFFCLGVAYLFHMAGLSLSLGAFAAGLMVAESPYGRQVTADILPLRDNFLGLFFASVGMLLDVRFVAEHLPQVVGLAALGFSVKVLVILVVSLFNRIPLSISAIMALTLCQIGEFSFIIASRGLDLGLLTAVENQYFLSVSVLSMAFTPFLYRLAPRLAMSQAFMPWKSIAASREAESVRATVIKQKRRGGEKAKASNHAIIIGFGISGQNMAAAMASLAIPYKAVELNYDAVKSLKRRGFDIHFGDATRPETLEHVGILTARLVVVAVSGAKILPHVIAAIRHLRPDVQVIVRSQYVRDVETLRKEPGTDIVVAEIETSIELLARALKVYGVPSEDIRRYMEQARQQLTTFSQLSSSLKSPTLSLPSWEALSSIKPFRIGESYAAISRSLADLDLPRRTGTSVVSVGREGLGTTIPDGSFVFQAGDVSHLIGSPDSLALAERILKDGASALRG